MAPAMNGIDRVNADGVFAFWWKDFDPFDRTAGNENCAWRCSPEQPGVLGLTADRPDGDFSAVASYPFGRRIWLVQSWSQPLARWRLTANASAPAPASSSAASRNAAPGR